MTEEEVIEELFEGDDYDAILEDLLGVKEIEVVDVDGGGEGLGEIATSGERGVEVEEVAGGGGEGTRREEVTDAAKEKDVGTRGGAGKEEMGRRGSRGSRSSTADSSRSYSSRPPAAGQTPLTSWLGGGKKKEISTEEEGG